MTKDKIRPLGGKGDPEFDSAAAELLHPTAALGDDIDLKTDQFLDIPEETMKACTGDELQMLSKLFELDMDVQAKAVQGMIDYMAEVVAKSTALMVGLDVSKLATALNTYQQTHGKAEKPQPKVAADLKKIAAGYYSNEIKELIDGRNKLPEAEKKYLPSMKIWGGAVDKSTRTMSFSWELLAKLGAMLDADGAARDAAEKKTAAYEGMRMMEDMLFLGITYQELADAVNANEKEKTDATVRKVFREMYTANLDSANYFLDRHMPEIIKAATDIEQ